MLTILEKYGDIFMDALRHRHIQAGQKASGKTLEDGFSFTNTETVLKIYGPDFVETLEDGRRSGGFPPTDAIYQWSIDKGFNFEKEYQRRGFAFVVARKIAEQGSYLFRKGVTFNGTPNPISEVFNEEALKEMTKQIEQSFIDEAKIDIHKIFEEWEYKQ